MKKDQKNTSRPAEFPPPPPPCPDPEQVTPPMLVNEISRLFGAWMRTNSGETVGVMSQNSARLIMRHLSFCDGVSQLELVRATSLKAPTISVTLKKMEEEGLIRRETNEDDQRAVRVYLTEKGRGHDEFVRENLLRADRIVMRNFSEEEYEVTKKVLLRMRDNILSDLCASGVFPDRPPFPPKKDADGSGNAAERPATSGKGTF